MKKARQLLFAGALAGMLLTGCAGGGKSAFSPSQTCVYVKQDGSVSSALVESTEGDEIDKNDLKQYLEAIVIRYNQANGGDASAVNRGGNKLPAALSYMDVKDGLMTAIFDYSTVDDLVKFRETDDNSDKSNTITALLVKSSADAAAGGWLDEKKFLKADGSDAATEEVKSDAAATVAAIEGGGTVMFSGKVLYMSEGVEKQDEYTVTVPEDGISYVVFK